MRQSRARCIEVHVFRTAPLKAVFDRGSIHGSRLQAEGMRTASGERPDRNPGDPFPARGDGEREVLSAVVGSPASGKRAKTSSPGKEEPPAGASRDRGGFHAPLPDASGPLGLMGLGQPSDGVPAPSIRGNLPIEVEEQETTPISGNLTVSHQRRVAQPDGPLSFFVRLLDASKSIGFGFYRDFIDHVFNCKTGSGFDSMGQGLDKLVGQNSKLDRLQRKLTDPGSAPTSCCGQPRRPFCCFGAVRSLSPRRATGPSNTRPIPISATIGSTRRTIGGPISRLLHRVPHKSARKPPIAVHPAGDRHRFSGVRG